MPDPTQYADLTDHQLVNRVFDVIDDLHDTSNERYMIAQPLLVELRRRTQPDHSDAADTEFAAAIDDESCYACYGCEGVTSSIRRAFGRGEPCPICGLQPEVSAAVGEARSRTIEASDRRLDSPLIAFLVARGQEVAEDDPVADAVGQVVDRVIGWPRRPDDSMWQRDEDVLRILAAAYSSHPDYDASWDPR